MDVLTRVQSIEYENSALVSSSAGLNGGEKKALTASGGRLVFYQFENATTVNTYSLIPGSATPVLLKKSQMNIDNIVELSF